MGKSEAGPDMLDCALYAREIEKQTGKRVTMLLELEGSEHSPQWSLSLLALPASVVAIAEGEGVAVAARWPSRKHRTFESALFSSLALLDAEIGKAAFQETLDLR